MALFIQDDQDIQLKLNGFKLNGVDDNGVEWHTSFQDVSGIFDGVGTNLSTDKLVWTDGMYSNIPTRAGRSISVQGFLMGACPDILIASWEAFKGQLKIDDQLLEIQLGNIQRQTTVKQSAGVPLIKWAGRNMLQYSFGLEAMSPYLLSGGSPIQGSTHLAQSSGGMIFPKAGYHFESPTSKSQWLFGEKIISGAVSLTSGGNAQSPVTIRIDGPVTNPTVSHSPSGRTLTFVIELGAGSYLTADSGTREILVNGEPPINGVVANRQWFYAQPGQNTFRFGAKESGNGAMLTVSFREAYL